MMPGRGRQPPGVTAARSAERPWAAAQVDSRLRRSQTVRRAGEPGLMLVENALAGGRALTLRGEAGAGAV
jgi:hypothetical protein